MNDLLKSRDLLIQEPTLNHTPQMMEMPEDLTNWVPQVNLATLSVDAINNWLDLPATQSFGVQNLASRAKWLSMITFCYATGRWSSAGIAAELEDRNSILQHFSVQPDSWHQIMEFRRLSRNSIRCCLAFLLQNAWQTWESGCLTPLSTSQSISGFAPDYTSSSWFLSEADARIRMAINHDRLELED